MRPCTSASVLHADRGDFLLGVEHGDAFAHGAVDRCQRGHAQVGGVLQRQPLPFGLDQQPRGELQLAHLREHAAALGLQRFGDLLRVVLGGVDAGVQDSHDVNPRV